jgi:hypothetical protein
MIAPGGESPLHDYFMKTTHTGEFSLADRNFSFRQKPQDQYALGGFLKYPFPCDYI